MSADSFELQRFVAGLVPRRFRRGCFAAPPFLGYLERPAWVGDTLIVRGWLVSRGTPITKVHVRTSDREVPVMWGLARPDVTRAFPQEHGASQAGFALEVRLPRELRSIDVWVTLAGGRRLCVFTTNVPHAFTRTPAPALTLVEDQKGSAPASTRHLAVNSPGPSAGDIEAVIARCRPRVIVELDPAGRDSPVVAAARRLTPDAVVYLVGEGLGSPGHATEVCVIDAPVATALSDFADGTVDLILARGSVPQEWRTKLRPGGLAVAPGSQPRAQLPRRRETGDVEVSIVIPVRGKLELTRQCLDSLAAHASTITFEIIVVDDASPDNTAVELGREEGVRLITLTESGGFGHACNRGAEEARGRFLVFLNNDTEVTPGWLAALRQTFVDEPQAGYVGAKLVFPDGTLQEAGSLMFRDASAMNYGRGDDPEHPAYGMLRDTDYCSAACAMIPTPLFRQLGGFDPLYAPAYYEDGDLAFRVRQRGLRVLYQPFARVIHHEGGTSGTDVREGTKRFQVVNQAKFRQRWESTLASYGERPADERSVDPDRHGGPRVLVIDHRTPRPDQDAGSMRMDCLLILLQRAGLQVTFVADDLERDGAYAERLQRRGVEVLYQPWVRSIGEHLAHYGHRYEMIVISKRDPAEKHLAEVRAAAPNAFVAFDTVDLHFVREIGAARIRGDASALALAEQRREIELALIRESHVPIVVSPDEAELLARNYGVRDAVVISTVHEIAADPPPMTRRRDILFVGYFVHAPNADAMLWFARDVLPGVCRRLPGARVHVVGRNPPDELCRLASGTLLIHGHVPDLEPYVDAARVMIAPLRFGAGVKGKITHSLSRGLPVVATSLAVEGMELVNGDHVMIADTPEAFAEAIERVYRDDVLWGHLSQGGRHHAQTHYSFAAAARGVDRLLERASLGARARGQAAS